VTYIHCQESNDVGVLYNPKRKRFTPNLGSEIYFFTASRNEDFHESLPASFLQE